MPLFICGLHRSGTTLLETWLEARCNVCVLRAPVPENEGQHLQDVYPQALARGGPGRFAFHPDMHPGLPDEAAATLARERLSACWTPWIEGEGATLLEKSPPNLTKIAWLRAVFPGARFIIITRDPRAVAAATLKWSGGTLTDLVFHWQVAHSAALRDLKDDCVCIRYEDFCSDPERVFTDLMSRLDLKPSPSPREVPERFRTIASSNDRYLKEFTNLELGTGVWTEFGYDLSR